MSNTASLGGGCEDICHRLEYGSREVKRERERERERESASKVDIVENITTQPFFGSKSLKLLPTFLRQSWPEAMELFPQHVFIDDGQEETLRSAFEGYRFCASV